MGVLDLEPLDQRDVTRRMSYLQSSRPVDWNREYIDIAHTTLSFGRQNLANCDISAVDFRRCFFMVSSFERTILRSACMIRMTCPYSNFSRAILNGAQCSYMQAWDSNFTEASLARVVGVNAIFVNCDFTKADLTEATFRRAAFENADLSTAIVTRTKFEEATYDELTKFPPGFCPKRNGMIWTGCGVEPAEDVEPLEAVEDEISDCAAVDCEDVIELMWASFDSERVHRALNCPASFEVLQFDVDPNFVVALLKCKRRDISFVTWLSSSGHFGCYDQNLFRCRAQKGFVCEHMLKMVVGLSAGPLLPSEAIEFLSNSVKRKPTVDKTLALATFLRFKGVESGEMDWRSSEQIPEDFYAY